MFVIESIASHIHHGCERDADVSPGGWDAGYEPGNGDGVREAEDEFVDDAIGADGAGDER